MKCTSNSVSVKNPTGVLKEEIEHLEEYHKEYKSAKKKILIKVFGTLSSTITDTPPERNYTIKKSITHPHISQFGPDKMILGEVKSFDPMY